VGMGVGWNRDEMRNHGTTPATRGDKLNEQLAALKQIWTQDEAEFHGRFIDFDPIFSWPKPVQRPRAALERLRTLGDGWVPQAATAPEKLREVRQWLADNDRTDVPFMIWGAGRDKATLAGYAEAGVDEVTFLKSRQDRNRLRFATSTNLPTWCKAFHDHLRKPLLPLVRSTAGVRP
jgi:alkanesulfonate monooxygenase SsuD/methylene tetrahydromethanopterin reductase-like flavin-dependent oxidoreductase (luciferase family)